MQQPKPMPLQIWGRRNSVNVQKVLWCAQELALDFNRIDAGMAFGRNRDADYLAINPNGGIPTLVDGDFSLWESNSIMRYLAMQYEGEWLYPQNARLRAGIDRWLDWTLSRMQQAERQAFWGLIRTAEADRDWKAISASIEASLQLWSILDVHLASRQFAEGEKFSIADIALAAYARRWFGFEGTEKLNLPHFQRWYGEISRRPAFVMHLAPALS